MGGHTSVWLRKSNVAGGAHRFQESRIGKAPPGSDDAVCFNFASLLQQRGMKIEGAFRPTARGRSTSNIITSDQSTIGSAEAHGGCGGRGGNIGRKDTEGVALQIVDHHAGVSESSGAKRLNAQHHLPPFVLLAKFPGLKSHGWWEFVTDKKAASHRRSYR